MRRLRWVGCAAFAFVLLALSAGCSGDGGTTAIDDVASPVRGMIVDVRVAPGGGLDAMTVRDDGGRTLVFEVQLAEDAFVTAEHLREHIDQSLPVLVSFTGAGDRRVAHRIDDAP